MNNEFLINEEIKADTLRIINKDDDTSTIMTLKDALLKAYDEDMDLIMITDKADPPICQIADYNKFMYERSKKIKKAKKNQKITETKELRLSLNIDSNDIETKRKAALKFFSKGNNVKVTIRFRGREIANTKAGIEVLNEFAESLKNACNIEKKPKVEGKTAIMFLSAKK